MAGSVKLYLAGSGYLATLLTNLAEWLDDRLVRIRLSCRAFNCVFESMVYALPAVWTAAVRGLGADRKAVWQSAYAESMADFGVERTESQLAAPGAFARACIGAGVVAERLGPMMEERKRRYLMKARGQLDAVQRGRLEDKQQAAGSSGS